jgi:DNA-binding MarR family transcriptional regulator
MVTIQAPMPNPEGFYNLLKELFFILDDGDRSLFSRFNLSVPRFYALVHLDEEPGVSSSRLSDLMLCDKSNITRLIKGMESEGLVVRQPHETDGRASRLYLTEFGQTVCRQVRQAHLLYNQLRFNGLGDLEQDNLLEGLEKLKAGLQHELADHTLIEQAL